MNRFFQQAITLERQDGHTRDGSDAYAAPVTIQARMVGETRLVRDAQGREVTSTTKVSTTGPISVGDVVTDEAGTRRPVLAVSEARDTNGRLSHRIARL